MSLEALVDKQYDLGQEIQRLIRNFNKDSKERKTPEYFTQKLEVLTNWAEDFHKNHQKILAHKKNPEDVPYLADGYYDEISETILKYQKVFETGAMQLIDLDKDPDTPGMVVKDQGAIASETKKILRNQRALMTALTRTIDEIYANLDKDHHASYYTTKASIIEKYMVDLATNNGALWALTEEDSIEDYTLLAYYELEARAAETIIELQQHMQPRHLDQGTRPSLTSGPNEAEVRLPRITLPKFDGNYQRWIEFKDLFTELIHNTSISDAKKMHYLTTTLEGEPKNLIKHLPAVGTNYSIAWAIITSRYDNKRILVSALLNKLLKQSVIKKEGAQGLKSLHDITRECIHGLKAQAIPVQHWDAILVHILLQKMDEETQKVFEQGLNDNRRLITLDETLKFLERRFQSFEAREKDGDSVSRRTCASAAKTGSSENCQICNKGHKIYACKKFTEADAKQKWKYVKDMHLCVNCLREGHRVKECKSRNCTKCPKMHHTLLHNTSVSENKKKPFPDTHTRPLPQVQPQAEPSSSPTTSKVSLVTNNNSRDASYVILATARIELIASNGQRVECRAVLDAGSQINLITDRLLKKLGGKPRPMSMTMEGVGINETKMRHQITIKFQSTINDFKAEVDAHIIPKIVSNQPTQFLNTERWGIPQDIVLADPEFYKPGRIDCLLGAEVFFDLLTEGKIHLADNLPLLKNTVFGWIVAGRLEPVNSNKVTCGICTTKDLEETISKFWDTEGCPENKEFTEDELLCEAHYLQHTVRDQSGRFVVKLPLKDHPSVLTDSKGLAYERFKSIERRLENNLPLKEQYVNFMREYEALGHMSKVQPKDISTPYYYIPHHCVLRPDSLSTKLRVVFDASARRPSGMSLNDIMFSGPTVQSELFSILLRFRTRRFVLKTDVEKMFRQMWVHPEDRNLHLIMWRENIDQPIHTYQLNTVTYGTRSAPYLAARCLNYLADEYKGRYPYGSTALRNDFYVDDGLTGADSLGEALEIQQQLITILGGAGMKLKKWVANHPKLLSGIAPEDQEVDLNFDSKEDQSTKTLGLQWLPKSDVFCVKVSVKKHHTSTKRTMSSDLAHIYDPLGLIGPVLVTGKILLQRTWQLKTDWDEELPEDIQKQWATYRQALTSLELVKFPRYVLKNPGFTNVQIHTFADASEKAYGAVVYLRTVQKDKTITVNLLCSKSRVAPLKIQTIPRLELCAALLAAELTARVKADLGYQDKPSYLWTDSQIVLAWLNNHPGKLPVYVAHRVVKILRLTIPDQWRHVPSKQNPADVLSRGLKPREFASSDIWMFGPLFLYQSKALWPTPVARDQGQIETQPENAVTGITTTQISEEGPLIYTIQTRNSFLRLNKVVGYILRFIRNLRRPKDSRPEFQQLSPLELDAALKTIVRQIQLCDFADVRKNLTKHQFVPKSNELSSLTPFLDEEGIIRVGGRLQLSMQQQDAIHQMLLPANDPIVRLLVEKIHRDSYHCGPQALLAQVRQRFWPLKGKSLSRAVVRHCVRCTRAGPRLFNQLMGNLPAHRVQPARPFLNSGVDYCGPFSVHYRLRGKRPQKAYIAVFCCFATKAVHLELVTDLTTDAFIGALKRFVARRGNCKTLYCDNATNFVGARNQLKELEEAIYSGTAKEAIIGACSIKGIDFRFIPPRSPHFGGLWEAAVKSAKHLLYKNVSPMKLTYEELETVVVEVEAILNSRPLIPSSTDANDFNAITPGHFLIGEELTSSVDVLAQEPKRKLLERWRLVSDLKHHFWKRWSDEYLHQLQYRHKWKEPRREILPGTMVIIKEDNLPVLQWPLGRIIRTIKGDDGLVRVCEVQTQRGIFKRPLHRLAPLFPEDENIDDKSEQAEQSQENQQSTVPMPIATSGHQLPRPESLDSTAVPKKRPRLQPSLLLTVLALMMLPLALCSPVKLTKFDNKPGIYFEKVGHVRLATSNWNVVVFFDLQPLHNELNLLLDGILSLQKLCDHSATATADPSCPFLLKYFDNTRDDLQGKFNLLSSKRAKRGALDIVGNVASSLFGVLDSNYAAKMSDTIDFLRKNDAHLELLFKNQTSLIDSTINIIKANQLNSQQKFDDIDKRISGLLYDEAETSPFHQLHVNQNILALSLQLFTMVSNLLWTYSSIMDVLIDSHHDKLNPMLLTPYQLNEEIMKIKSHLTLELQLPIQNNLLEAYRLCKVSGVVAKRHVIFNIQLPLADPREFNLLHLIPIMATLNSSLTAIRSSAKYMAISPHRDEFVTFSEHQLDACLTLNDNEYLCKNAQATYRTTSTDCKCELDLFFNQSHPRCDFQRLEDEETWYQLHRPNHWIYATVNSSRLNAVCNSESFSMDLQGCGLVQLQPECIIKSDHLTIRGHANLVTKLYTTIMQPTMPLGWSKQYDAPNISTIPFKTNIHELELIQKKLAQIHSSSLPTEQPIWNNHSVIVSYVAISFVIITIAIVLLKGKCPRKDQLEQPFHPTPAIRTHINVEGTAC